MEENNLLETLSRLLHAPEKWMIRDESGNYHELSSGIRGIPELVSAKKEIYRLYFGKERISGTQFAALDQIHSEMMHYIWTNFSHKVKLEIQEEMEPILQKYNLKKINKRTKK